MSSSISSSRSRPNWLGWIAVVAVLLLLEGITRVVLFRASRDLSRFGDYPERARVLAGSERPRTAFVGNSITEQGIDPRLFADVYGGSAEAFVADASQINTWRWMVDAAFYRQRLQPDVIVVPFHTTDLEDAPRLEVGRLAQFFVHWSDVPELFRYDLTTLEPRAEFLVSAVWATFAARDRIKERVLRLVPGYRPYAEHFNGVNFEYELKRKHADPGPASHGALERFLNLAKARGVKVVFVAFPTRSPYELSRETIGLINEAGSQVVDLRTLPDLKWRHFVDPVHLNHEGRKIFTTALAQALRASTLEHAGDPDSVGADRSVASGLHTRPLHHSSPTAP